MDSREGHRQQLLDRLRVAVAGEDDPIAQAVAATHEAMRTLDERVAQARRSGRPWSEIAEVNGLSRQAAWNRWRHLEPIGRHDMKTWQCPHCDTVATYRHNLRKHLMGTFTYGGHELAEADAERVLDHLEYGT